MDAEVYPDPKVIEFVTLEFHPVKVHIKEQPQQFERFKAEWTPTLLVLDPIGTERHRVVGFLPAADLVAQLDLGLARSLFGAGRLEEAAKRFERVAQAHATTDAAAEAIYWSAVASYKASGKPDPLGAAARRLKDRYPQSEWTKKASVWLG